MDEEEVLGRSVVRRNLVVLRESRMLTQVRLAEEAGVSPTTVSGIENGRISRPRFGTVRKLAVALEVEPEDLLPRGGARGDDVPAMLSLEWSLASGDEEFERELEAASIDGLSSLSQELGEEELRLRRLYGEARGEEQRRLIKGMIRRVAANSGSVAASIYIHKDRITEKLPERRSRRDEHLDSPEPSS
jgi:transcriptional regulator with XRE-family HTH domain